MKVTTDEGSWRWHGLSAREWVDNRDQTHWRDDVQGTLLVLMFDERLPADLRLGAMQLLNNGIEAGVLKKNPRVQEHVLHVIMQVTLGPKHKLGFFARMMQKRVIRAAEQRFEGARAAVRVGSHIQMAVTAAQVNRAVVDDSRLS